MSELCLQQSYVVAEGVLDSYTMHQMSWLGMFIAGISGLWVIFPAWCLSTKLENYSWNGNPNERFWLQKLAMIPMVCCAAIGVAGSFIGVLELWVSLFWLPLIGIFQHSTALGWTSLTVFLIIAATIGEQITEAMRRLTKIHNGNRHDWLVIPLSVVSGFLHLFFFVPMVTWYCRTTWSGFRYNQDAGRTKRQYHKWTGVSKNIGTRFAVWFLSPLNELRILDFASFIQFQESAPKDDQPEHWAIVKDPVGEKHDCRSVEIIHRNGSKCTFKLDGSPFQRCGNNGYYRLRAKDSEGLEKVFLVITYDLETGFTEELLKVLVTKALRYVTQYNNLRHEYDDIKTAMVTPLLEKVAISQGGNNAEAEAGKVFVESGPKILSEVEVIPGMKLMDITSLSYRARQMAA